ncbi:cyclohexanone monooxygenase [Mycena floridula]|nr:cyclohexanone monooxygenase [Mycena floridula]
MILVRKEGRREGSTINKIIPDPWALGAAPMNSSQQKDIPTELDCLIVGAGFGGIYLLIELRKRGYRVKAFDTAKSFGGIWYWNTYPGARVDSEVPVYEFSDPELWKDWEWTHRYADAKQIQDYFAYVDKKLQLSNDIFFDTSVVSAKFDQAAEQWIVGVSSGETVRTRFLLLCTGIGAKPYVPEFPGLENFKGQAYHTSNWPREGVDMVGKRVGVIGTGATGVQVVQAVSKDASKLVVFQRTPNFALPMQQHQYEKGELAKMKETYHPIIFRRRLQTTTGNAFDYAPKNLTDTTPEERFLFWQQLWDMGGFRFAVATYPDIFINRESNAIAYEFWRQKVIARVNDPAVAELLAPAVAPHAFAMKRPSLEEAYYEVFNQHNVQLDGEEFGLDVLAFATGYDAVTGGITSIDIEGTNGETIKEKWGKELATYLGYATAHFPNMWFTYGPHGPTAFSNGPSCSELQCNWILDCLEYMRIKDLKRIEPTVDAETSWTQFVNEIVPPMMKETGYLPGTGAWYMGSNIPGKPVATMNFMGGFPLYVQKGKESADNGYKGFVFYRDGKAIDQSVPEDGEEKVLGNGI